MINPIHLCPGLILLPVAWASVEQNERNDGRFRDEHEALSHYYPPLRLESTAPAGRSLLARFGAWVQTWLEPAAESMPHSR